MSERQWVIVPSGLAPVWFTESDDPRPDSSLIKIRNDKTRQEFDVLEGQEWDLLEVLNDPQRS